MTPEEKAGVEMLARTYKRWEGMPPQAFLIGRMETYALVIACQLSTTYPDAPKSMLSAWKVVGRQLQEKLCDDPEIYTMLEAGWHREYDVPRPEKAEEQPSGADATAPSCTYRGCGKPPEDAVHMTPTSLTEGHLYQDTVSAGTCLKCLKAFDETDTSFEGRAQQGGTPFCRECVTRCHDTEIADHWCKIDEWRSEVWKP